MNFINSWLAEPWEDKSSRLKSDVVMEKALPYERGQMPEAAQLLTCGIDVQLGVCQEFCVNHFSACHVIVFHEFRHTLIHQQLVANERPVWYPAP